MNNNEKHRVRYFMFMQKFSLRIFIIKDMEGSVYIPHTLLYHSQEFTWKNNINNIKKQSSYDHLGPKTTVSNTLLRIYSISNKLSLTNF